MNKLMVDVAQLEKAASKLNQQAKDCEAIYNQLITLTGSTGTAWEGEDSLAFVAQIKGPLDDLHKMQSTMKEYAEFLQYSSKTYRDAQQDIIAAAKSL
ncbi:WXG100 family type VII secretion target [Bacillus sp. EB01]|jgi:WXG100 family type VII secretion target|uniref:WXG100 family type VII secretion target n=1 Tax=Bacillus sp. EB01 TaxID=1347086 RepID=UPI0005C5ACF9|nr:WXG100 family type VII secretion target [Bacillus sp. EB01]